MPYIIGIDGCRRFVSDAVVKAWHSWAVGHPFWHHPIVHAAVGAIACGGLAGTLPLAPVLPGPPIASPLPPKPLARGPYWAGESGYPGASYGTFGPGAFSFAPIGGSSLAPEAPGGFGGGFAGGFGGGGLIFPSGQGYPVGSTALPIVQVSYPAPLPPVGSQPVGGAQPAPQPVAPVTAMQPTAPGVPMVPSIPSVPVVDTTTQPGTDVPEPGTFALLAVPLALAAWGRARG